MATEASVQRLPYFVARTLRMSENQAARKTATSRFAVAVLSNWILVIHAPFDFWALGRQTLSALLPVGRLLPSGCKQVIWSADYFLWSRARPLAACARLPTSPGATAGLPWWVEVYLRRLAQTRLASYRQPSRFDEQ